MNFAILTYMSYFGVCVFLAHPNGLYLDLWHYTNVIRKVTESYDRCHVSIDLPSDTFLFVAVV